MEMNDDRLRQLLHDADSAGDPAVAPAPEVARRVFGRWRRRRARRIAGIAVTASALLGMSTWMFVHPTFDARRDPAVIVASKPRGEELRQRLARLESQIDSDERIANHMLAIERLSRAKARLAELDIPTVTVRVDPADRAACCALYQADRIARINGAKQSAERAYREIIDYFPGSPSADAARQRLGEPQKEG
jgi:hypothetical protein